MRKKYNTPHRSRVVKTRLSEDEYADFTARLAPYGISQSEFLRQAIRRTTIRPVIHVSAVNDELLSAVGKLAAEYGRIGGNLNQIARYLNEYGAPYNALSGEVRAAIADLAALKYEVLQKVGDAVGNTQAYVKWSIADLPILPQKWQYLVSTSTKKQFGVLQKLMHRPDVDSIVNSCDSGREGELIFRLVYQQAGCKKPVSRLWLSSMEESAIREGFANLKPSTEYDALYNAALCRERADWMVGINASRLFSCLYGQPLAVGRVMTPVLAMTVVRNAAIAAFVPEKFYTVDLELTSGCTASSRRIPEKSVAEDLLEACRKEMVATIQRITRKEKSESPPPLYDLTTLQRDANRLLGYSAQQTLDYVQSLYEKKLTTYPRTDSCYITDDDEEMLEVLTEELEGFFDIAPEDVDEAVPRTRRTVNREKVTDHHAILPTRSMLQADLEALPKGEQNVLKLIIARTLMAVSKPFRYLETLLTTECAGEEFTAKGKEVLEEGWKAVERKVLADILNRKQELTALPNAAENECGILNAELKEGQTSPPKHFTEDICCERGIRNHP